MVIFRALVTSQLIRERWRTAITLLAVGLGVALVLAIDLANATAVASFSQSVNLVARKVNLQVLGLGAGFNERLYTQVLEQDGVRDARPIIEASLTIGAKSGDPLAGEVLHIIGSDLMRPLPDPTGAQASPPILPAPTLLLEGSGAIISDRVAKSYHLRIGSAINGLAGDRKIRLYVAGILPPGGVGIDSSVVFVDIVTAQEQFSHLGRLDRIDLEVAPENLTAVTQSLTKLLPSTVRVLTPATRNGEIARMLQSFALNLQALAAIALLVGLFLVFNTVAISVVQRRGEIGILRGLGASRQSIIASFLQEGLVFGIGGSVLGIIGGAFLAQGAVGAVSKTVATLYVSTHADGVTYSALPFLKAAVLGIVSSLVASYMPAREASLTMPAALMRSNAAESTNPRPISTWLGLSALLAVIAFGLAHLPAVDSLPLFGYLAGIVAIASGVALAPPTVYAFGKILKSASAGSNVTLRLASMNLTKGRGRISVAVATLMTAIGMMVSIAVLVGSFRTTVVAWAGESLRADLFIRPLGLVDASGSPALAPNLFHRLSQVRGVASLDTFRAVSLPFQGRLTTLAATEMHSLVIRPRLRLLDGARLEQLAAGLERGTSVLASEPFATRFHMSAGDTILIPTPSGPTTLRIAAIYNDYSSDGGFLLLDSKVFTRLFREPGVDSLAVYAKPGQDLVQLRSRILQAALPSQIDVESTRELRGYVITVFDRTFAITYALYSIAMIIAGLGIVSTLFALVLERRREIGILRYLGLSTLGVRWMILIEACSIGIMGGTLGIVLGVVLALDLIYVINRQAFGWLIELTMPWSFLGEAFILVVIASMIAGLIPARIAARIRTADGLREE